jgi:hypothetical protein
MPSSCAKFLLPTTTSASQHAPSSDALDGADLTVEKEGSPFRASGKAHLRLGETSTEVSCEGQGKTPSTRISGRFLPYCR